MSAADLRERDEAIELLNAWLKPGDTVYTVLRHVSDSRMSRWISLVKPYVNDKGEVDVLHLDWSAAAVLGRRHGTRGHDGIEVHGAGMDMGFELVYSLSRRLFDDGYALNHRWL